MARHGDRLRGAQMDRRVADPAVAPAAHGADPAQHQGGARARPRDRPVQGRDRGPDQARKSVVSGKSVSVRVDLGGRRIIKNKNHITSAYQQLIMNTTKYIYKSK